MEAESGEAVHEGGEIYIYIYIYLQLIPVVVQQKLTQHCEAIMLQ